MTPLISGLLYIMCTASCKGNKTQNRKNVTFGKVFCTVHNSDHQYKENGFRNVTGKEVKRKILQSSQDMFYWDFLNITKKDHEIIDIKFI